MISWIHFGFYQEPIWLLKLYVMFWIIGILLIGLGLFIVIRKHRIVILLIGLGFFLIPFNMYLRVLVEQKLNEHIIIGNYILKNKATNIILTLSGDKTFEFKPIDSVNSFEIGIWKLDEGDHAPYIKLTFNKNESKSIQFSVIAANQAIILEQLNAKNQIILIKK